MKNIFKGLGFGFVALALSLSLATSANAALTLGALTVTSNGALTVDGAAASNVAIGTAATTGTITIGHATLTTGNVVINGGITGGANTLFNNATTSTIAIGGAVTSGTITIGNASGASVVAINGGTGSANTLFNNVTTGSITIGAVATGNIDIGTGNVSGTINIGNGGGASSKNINIGKVGVSSIIIDGATLALNGHIISGQTPAPTTSVVTYTVGAVLAGSSDTKGQFNFTATAAAGSATLVFNTAYASNPICTVSPASALTQPEAGKVYVSAITTGLTINYVIAPAATLQTWNYICVQ